MSPNLAQEFCSAGAAMSLDIDQAWLVVAYSIERRQLRRNTILTAPLRERRRRLISLV